MASPTQYYNFFTTTLKRSMTTAAQTASIVLNPTKDNDGSARTLTSTTMYFRFTDGEKQELIKCTGWTQDSDGNFTLSGVTRDINPDDGTDDTGAGNPVKWNANTIVEAVIPAQVLAQMAMKDQANTFTGTQTISSTNKLQLNDAATYIYDDGTNLLFKDSANSETSLATLAATGGSDEKTGVDSAATPDYLGAANSDGVLRTGDGLSYTDGGDFVTLDVTKLKDASATELTIASGVVTATGSSHKIDTEADASTDDLDTINGGADGDFLLLYAENDARSIVVKHGTGNILTSDNNDFTIDTDDKAITLRYDGTNWKEVSRANVASQTNYVSVVYLGASNSSAVGASSVAVNNFDTHTYPIPANDITASVAYEIEGVVDITWLAGDVALYIKLGSTECARVYGTPTGNQMMKFRGVVRGTAAAGASVAVFTEIEGIIGNEGGTAGNGIDYGADYDSDNVATNGALTLQMAFQYTSSNAGHSAVLKSLTVKKISTTAF